MKVRRRGNRLRGTSELIVAAKRTELLDVRQAERLRVLQHPHYLSMNYTCQQDASGAVLRYDITSATPLHRYLVHPHTIGDIVRFLSELASALSWSAAHARAGAPLFAVHFVFVDAQGGLRLAYVPIVGADHAPVASKDSPLTLIAALGDTRHLIVTSPADTLLSERITGFTLASQGVFSLNAYQAFVAEIDAEESLSCEYTAGQVSLPSSDDAVPTRLAGTRIASWHLTRVSTGETYPLNQGMRLQLGRGSACAFRILGNPQVSRQHAVVSYRNGEVTLEDLGSTNGTYIQGEVLRAPVHIACNTRFSLADEEFLLAQDDGK